MAQALIGGMGQTIWYPQHIALAPSFANSGAIDATGEKLAFIGRVFIPGGGTKSITNVGFRWGDVTTAGGSALTLSLQDVSLASGPTGQPDGTQDQTVAITNGQITSNTWLESDALSASRSVAHGDWLAIVWEYDGSGRLGADVVRVSGIGIDGGSTSRAFHGCAALADIGGWALSGGMIPNVVLKADDGSYCTLMGALPCSAVTAHAFKQDTGTADEYALAFQVAAPITVDGVLLQFLAAADTSNFEIVLYDGTTPMTDGTITIDGNTLAQANNTRQAWFPFSDVIALQASHQYYLAIKPTQTTSTVTVYSFTVANAGHLALHPGGANFNYTTRLDEGSWAAATTTRRMFLGLSVSHIDDGAGGGGGTVPIPTSMSGGLLV